MEQLTKNQAVATSQEAVQNQNEPQLRDENAHNDKSVHGVLRSEERFSRNAETDLVCRLLLEKKKQAMGKRGGQHEHTHSCCLGHCHRRSPGSYDEFVTSRWW